MKTNILRTLILLLCTTAFLTSCDNSDDATPEPSKEEMLMAHEWKGDQVQVENVNIESIPGTGNGAATFKTLRITFNDDNTYDATFTVDNKEEQFSGNWELSSDGSMITLESFGQLNIDTLTENNLNVSGSLSSESVEFIAQLMGIDANLIRIFTGGGPVDTELRFVK